MALSLFKTLIRSSNSPSTVRSFRLHPHQRSNQRTHQPMDAYSNPAIGHPIEFICLDLNEPATCKYCGLRYVQEHHH